MVVGDVDALDGIATESFTLVGQLGFMLDKMQWLDRYRDGDGDGDGDGQALYRGQANDGQFPATHVLVRQGDSWRPASLHPSPITPAPAAGR